MARRRRVATAAIIRLGGRIERWRQGRPHRTAHMPEPLWHEATRLAQAHGAHFVATTLGVKYTTLRVRMDLLAAAAPKPAGPSKRAGSGARRPRIQRAAPGVPPPDFVELPAAVATTGTVVELVDAGGRRVTIRFGGPSEADVAAVVREFLARASA